MSDPWAEFKKDTSVEVVKSPPKKTSPKKEAATDQWAEFKKSRGVTTESLFDRLLKNPMAATQEELDKLPKEQRDKIAEYAMAQFQGGYDPAGLERLKKSPLVQQLSDPSSYQFPSPGKMGAQIASDVGAATRGVVQGASSPISMVADPLYQLLGLPAFSQSLEQSLTQLGVPEPKSAAQRVMQQTVAGLSGSGAYTSAGHAMQDLYRNAGASNGGLPGMLNASENTPYRIGQAMAEQPMLNAAANASGSGAGQTAAETGVGQEGQMAASLGAALALGGGLQPRMKPPVSSAPVNDLEFADILKKAAKNNGDAQRQMAAMWETDTAGAKAAQDLGLKLPADVFSDNPQIQEAAGAMRGNVGDRTLYYASKGVSDRVNALMEDIGAQFESGSPVTAPMSDRIKGSIKGTREAVREQENNIFREIDKIMPPTAIASTDNLKQALESIRQQQGSRLSSIETRLMDAVNDPKLSYAALRREGEILREIKQAAGKPGATPQQGIDRKTISDLYDAFVADRAANVAKAGGDDAKALLQQGNALTVQRKNLDLVLSKYFGRDQEGGIGNAIASAISSAKDSGKFNTLMKIVPDELKGDTIASGIAYLSRSKDPAIGGIDLEQFTKTFRGLMDNPTVIKEAADRLGSDKIEAMRSLYVVANRINKAQAAAKPNAIMTNAVGADNLMSRIMDSTFIRAAGTAGGAAGGGLPGAVVAGAGQSALYNMLSKGSRKSAIAAAKLFNSDTFQELAVEASMKPNVSTSLIRDVATSPEFNAFADKVGIPRTGSDRFSWIANSVNPSLMNQPKDNQKPPTLSALEAQRLKKVGN